MIQVIRINMNTKAFDNKTNGKNYIEMLLEEGWEIMQINDVYDPSIDAILSVYHLRRDI